MITLMRFAACGGGAMGSKQNPDAAELSGATEQVLRLFDGLVARVNGMQEAQGGSGRFLFPEGITKVHIKIGTPVVDVDVELEGPGGSKPLGFRVTADGGEISS
jgi:hypothetical protein